MTRRAPPWTSWRRSPASNRALDSGDPQLLPRLHVPKIEGLSRVSQPAIVESSIYERAHDDELTRAKAREQLELVERSLVLSPDEDLEISVQVPRRSSKPDACIVSNVRIVAVVEHENDVFSEGNLRAPSRSSSRFEASFARERDELIFARPGPQ